MTIGPDDEALLRELADALAEGSADDDLARVGRDVWSWRDPDGLLAELVSDSATETVGAGGVRGPGDLRVLRFDSGAVSVEAELVDGALRGLALGPGAITIELHNRSERVATAEVDATGWFELVLPTELHSRSELLRLQVLDAQGNHTWTDWFRS
jgi:hypothetical protein